MRQGAIRAILAKQEDEGQEYITPTTVEHSQLGLPGHGKPYTASKIYHKAKLLFYLFIYLFIHVI